MILDTLLKPFRRKTTAVAVDMALKSFSLPELLLSANRAPKYSTWNITTAIKFGYEVNAVFNACSRLRAESAAEVPWRAMRRNADGDKEHDPTSELQKLIDSPNPDISWSEMIEHMVNSLDIAGNEYWTKTRGGLSGTKPLEVWPLDPRGMAITGGDASRLIRVYKYTPPGGAATKEIPNEEMVQVKNANPDSFLFGLPTIMAAGIGVDIYREARDAQKSSFQNRGLHDFAVILDPLTTPEQHQRIKETYSERQAGAKNNRLPLFSTRDVKPLSASPVEMDYINTVDSVVTEICSVMNTPPSMIGYMQDATLANFETARKVFWINGMVPLLTRISRQLTHQLAKDFGPEWSIEPDLSKVEALKANYTASVDAATKLWSMGVPFNEINQRLELGFDDIEGGDTGYLGSGLLPSNFDWSGGTENMDAATAKAMALLGYGKPNNSGGA